MLSKYARQSTENTFEKTRHIARIGMIAAVYAAFTLITILFLGSLAWGPIQFRISEALTVLALFTFDAVPGLRDCQRCKYGSFRYRSPWLA